MSSPWDDAVTTEVEFCPRTADGFATLAVNGKEVIRKKLADGEEDPRLFFEFKEKS